MQTVLHIWANPKPLRESFSQRLARAFIQRYRQVCPEDEIIDLDLYQQTIPLIDEDILKSWDQGGSAQSESGEIRAKLLAIERLVDTFMAADKYVFVTPMWNLSVPPLMKAYIDTICIVGKTFKYTDQGPVGLLHGKKAVHIQARGGYYSDGQAREFELGDRYIRTILNFMGVSDVETIVAEGMAQTPEMAQQILDQAIARAEKAAERFALPPMVPPMRPAQHSVHPIH